jgi:dihydroflavonol-4-reductase
MTRIGATGAFGFLGANFVAALLDGRGGRSLADGEVEVVAFASRTRSNPLFDPSRTRIAALDIMDASGMARAFEGLDAVAHFAGRVDFRRSMRRAVWDADVLGARNVFEAALAAGVPRLLYVSSVSALGRSETGRLADEESRPYGDPRWPISFASEEDALAAVDRSLSGEYRFVDRMRVAYFDSKLAGWELAKAYARDRGLPVVTIFPGTVVGSGDQARSISALVDGVWEGRLGLSLPGSTSFVGARDFAEGAVLAMTKGRVGSGYVVSGRDEHNLGYAEFMGMVAALARAEGWPAKARPFVPPAPLIRAAARAAEALAPGAGLTAALALSGSADNRCSSAKARSELGYEPGPSLDQAILECRRFSLSLRGRASGKEAGG